MDEKQLLKILLLVLFFVLPGIMKAVRAAKARGAVGSGREPEPEPEQDSDYAPEPTPWREEREPRYEPAPRYEEPPRYVPPVQAPAAAVPRRRDDVARARRLAELAANAGRPAASLKAPATAAVKARRAALAVHVSVGDRAQLRRAFLLSEVLGPPLSERR